MRVRAADGFDPLFEARDRGDWATVLDLSQRALAECEATRGPEHPLTAEWLAEVGRALDELDRPQEALPLLWRALAITEAAHPPGSPACVPRLVDLLRPLLATDQHIEAEELRWRAFDLVRQDRTGAGFGVYVREVERRLGRRGGCFELRRISLMGIPILFQKSNRHAAKQEREIAVLADAAGLVPNAARWWRAVAERVPPDDPEAALALARLAHAKLRLGDPEAALAAVQEGQGLARTLELPVETRGELATRLGECLLALGLARDALRPCEEGVALATTPEARSLRRDYVALAHHANGRPALAAETQAAALREHSPPDATTARRLASLATYRMEAVAPERAFEAADWAAAMTRRLHGGRSTEMAEVWLDRAALWTTHGDPEEASACFARATEILWACARYGDPAVVAVARRLAGIGAAAGEAEQELEALRIAATCARSPSSVMQDVGADVHEELARSCDRLGYEDEAWAARMDALQASFSGYNRAWEVRDRLVHAIAGAGEQAGLRAEQALAVIARLSRPDGALALWWENLRAYSPPDRRTAGRLGTIADRLTLGQDAAGALEVNGWQLAVLGLVDGVKSLPYAEALGERGWMLRAFGDLHAAIATLESALGLLDQYVDEGARARRIAAARLNQYRELRAEIQASIGLRRVLAELLLSALGPDHPEVVRRLLTVQGTYEWSHQPEEARAVARLAQTGPRGFEELREVLLAAVDTREPTLGLVRDARDVLREADPDPRLEPYITLLVGVCGEGWPPRD